MFIGCVQRLRSLAVSNRLAAMIDGKAKPAGVALVSVGLVAGLICTAPNPQSTASAPSASGAVGVIVTDPVAAASLDGSPAPAAKPPVIRKTAGTMATVKPQEVTVASASAQKLFSDFRRIGYRLEDLRKGAGAVPRVFVKTMPKDIGLVRSIPRRKAVFIKTMLPLILSINEKLRVTRVRVQDLAASLAEGAELSPEDRDWLAAQYDRFDVAPGALDVLLRRIDVIPPSLAMAQGAEESGWGSSRFALEGRALFGQRTFKDRPGIVPHKRGEGENFKVRAFDQLLDGVRSYVHNLNTDPAYTEFRELRARLRSEAGGVHGIDSLKLVEALRSYSQRGQDYIKTIKAIIRFNKLRALDDDRLKQAQKAVDGTPGPA